MSEEQDRPRTSGRRPFGQRGRDEEPRPFGAFVPRRRTPEADEPRLPSPVEDTQPQESAQPEEESPFLEPVHLDEDEHPEPETQSAPTVMRRRLPVDPGEWHEEGSASQPGSVLEDDEEFQPRVSQGVIDTRGQAKRPRRSRLEASRPSRKSIAPHLPEPTGEGRQVSEAMLQFRALFGSLATVFLTAAVIATLFTWLTPNSFLPVASADQLAVALATVAGPAGTALPVPPTSTPIPTAVPLNRIGIVSGHRGLHRRTGQPDPGAVCEDGLTEREVNEAIAVQVVDLLSSYGYEVDLLDEFDPRLEGYKALALVSIHADSCEYINESATGFKVAGFAETSLPEENARLINCLVSRYSDTTGLSFHPSVTFDMSLYHTFQEIAPSTPGVIIEVGFLYLDRVMLTEHADVAALGIARGVMCYLRDESLDGGPTATPSLTPTRVP